MTLVPSSGRSTNPRSASALDRESSISQKRIDPVDNVGQFARVYRVSHVGAIGSPRLRVACMHYEVSCWLPVAQIPPRGCEVSRGWLLPSPFSTSFPPSPRPSSLSRKEQGETETELFSARRAARARQLLVSSDCNTREAQSKTRLCPAFVVSTRYTGDLDSLAEEIYPTFDSRSSARSLARCSFARSLRRNRPETNR